MTYRVFSATVDEGTHISAGLELLQFHKYTVQRLNPPLPRIVMAAVPWFAGLRITPGGGFYQEQRSIFYGHGKYEHNMVLIRIGNLLFFVVAAAALYRWLRREAGEMAAVVAVLLFTTQPVVLGYCGLATHDAAGTAGLAVGLVAFSSWLRKPTISRAILLGIAYGFSVSCKFSNIGFVPIACAAIYVTRLIHDRVLRQQVMTAMASLLVVALAAFVTVWAGYAFTVGTMADIPAPLHKELGAIPEWLLDRLPPATPLAAPKFWLGIAELLQLDHAGMNSYLFEQTTTRGWWWYFPAALGLKTTLPSLALCFVGLGAVAWQTPRRWIVIEATAAVLGILVLCARSRLDLGLRYALPLYLPLSVAAAASALALADFGNQTLKRTAITLIVLHVMLSVVAHPDYFPYFNLLAGKDPSRYLVDSNLDWGQDVLRLRTVVRQLGIEHLAVLMAGDPDYSSLGFPTTYPVAPRQKSEGWIAVGDHLYRTEKVHGGWPWLEPYKLRRVGKSIRLYYVVPCGSS